MVTESFATTAQRIAADVWRNADSKTAFLHALGLEGDDQEVAVQWMEMIEAALNDRDHCAAQYVVSLITEKNALQRHPMEEVIVMAEQFADADLYLLFVLIGMERGRIEHGHS